MRHFPHFNHAKYLPEGFGKPVPSHATAEPNHLGLDLCDVNHLCYIIGVIRQPSSSIPRGGEVMNTDDKEINFRTWRQLYEAAVLELDPTKIQYRIAEAEKEIAKRAVVLMRENANGAEREALANAMQALNDLQRRLSDSRTRGTAPETEKT